MYNLLICDDNQVVPAALRDLIEEKYPSIFEITGVSAANEIDFKSKLDVVIMDIDLKYENGISVAMELKKHHKNAQVIFISSFTSYAQEIFEVHPIYFLNKPIDPIYLYKAIDRALDNIRLENDSFYYIERGHESISVPVRDIIYAESKLRRVRIITDSKEYEFYEKLDNVESKLADKFSFIRCHQSYLVNPRHIKSMSLYEIELQTGMTIPISKARYQNSRTAYMKFLTSD